MDCVRIEIEGASHNNEQQWRKADSGDQTANECCLRWGMARSSSFASLRFQCSAQ